MRIYHFSLFFLIILIVCVIQTDVKLGKIETAVSEKEKLTDQINTSLKDAVEFLADKDTSNYLQIDRNEAVDTFFLSLYSSMGITMYEERKDEINFCIPVLMITDVDGFYIYYYQSFTDANGTIYYERVCSEKFPYYMEKDGLIYQFQLNSKIIITDTRSYLPKTYQFDQSEVNKHEVDNVVKNLAGTSFLYDNEEFHMIRKQAIIDCIEKKLSLYVSKHNNYALSKNINYKFILRTKNDRQWSQNIDDINFLVVVQGLTYGYDIYSYNNILSSAANVIKIPYFVVEEKSWYKLYHKEGCAEIVNQINKIIYYTEEECAKQGAFACEKCILHGAKVPVIY